MILSDVDRSVLIILNNQPTDVSKRRDNRQFSILTQIFNTADAKDYKLAAPTFNPPLCSPAVYLVPSLNGFPIGHFPKGFPNKHFCP